MTDKATPDWDRLDDRQLGEHLRSLGPLVGPLDVDLVPAVRTALEGAEPTGRIERSRPLGVAAALILLAGALVMVIAPARSAVAGWLGIGRTEVEIIEELPPADPAIPPADAPTGESTDRKSIQEAAVNQLNLSVRLPAVALVGAPTGWEIRGSDTALELVVAWEGITMTARSSATGEPARKFVIAGEVVSLALTTDGDAALWIEGFHVREIDERVETVGNTLLWVSGGIEYRLSGGFDRSEAIEIASSFG